MRKLRTTDVFVAARLVTGSGLREDLAPLIKKIADEGYDDIANVGLNGILTALETFSSKKCEQMFYEFLAGPFEMAPEEVAELDIDVMYENLSRLVEENNLRNFMNALSKLISKAH
ncbi:MAG: hypothetical protein IKR93_02740 [Firmicutes bacterium]|nr:hypothetical protein [Bacillota bacterium]